MRQRVQMMAIVIVSIIIVFVLPSRVEGATYSSRDLVGRGIITDIELKWSDKTVQTEPSTLNYGSIPALQSVKFLLNGNSYLKKGDVIELGGQVLSGAYTGGFWSAVSKTNIAGVGYVENTKIYLTDYDNNASQTIEMSGMGVSSGNGYNLEAPSKSVAYITYMGMVKQINVILRNPVIVNDPNKLSKFIEKGASGQAVTRVVPRFSFASPYGQLNLQQSGGRIFGDTTTPRADKDYIVYSKVNANSNVISAGLPEFYNDFSFNDTIGPDGKTIASNGQSVASGRLSEMFQYINAGKGLSIEEVLETIKPFTVVLFQDKEGNYYSVTNWGRYGTKDSPLEKNSLGRKFYTSMMSQPWNADRDAANEVQALFEDTTNAVEGSIIGQTLRHTAYIADQTIATEVSGSWHSSHRGYDKPFNWSVTTRPTVVGGKGQSTVKYYYRDEEGNNLREVETVYGWGSDTATPQKYTKTAPMTIGSMHKIKGANTVSGDFPPNGGSRDIVFVYEKLPQTRLHVQYGYTNKDGKKEFVPGLEVGFYDSSNTLRYSFISSDNGYLSIDGNLDASKAIFVDRGTYKVRVNNIPDELKNYISSVSEVSVTAGELEQWIPVEIKTHPTVVSLDYKWDDNSNQDGKRPQPESNDIVLERLNINGWEEVHRASFVANKNSSKVTVITDGWRMMPKHKFKYRWKINNLSNGYSYIPIESNEIKPNEHNASTVISRPIDKTEISGRIVWNDDNNSMEQRPSKVILNLCEGNKIIKTVEVPSSDWSFNFGQYETNRDGKVINYYIEQEPIEGYIYEVDGYEISNTQTGGGPARLTPTGTPTFILISIVSILSCLLLIIMKKKMVDTK